MHGKAQNKPTQKLILGLILASFATVLPERVSSKPKRTIGLMQTENCSEEFSLTAAPELKSTEQGA